MHRAAAAPVEPIELTLVRVDADYHKGNCCNFNLQRCSLSKCREPDTTEEGETDREREKVTREGTTGTLS